MVWLCQTKGTNDLTSSCRETGIVAIPVETARRMLAALAKIGSYPALVGTCLSVVVCRIH